MKAGTIWSIACYSAMCAIIVSASLTASNSTESSKDVGVVGAASEVPPDVDLLTPPRVEAVPGQTVEGDSAESAVLTAFRADPRAFLSRYAEDQSAERMRELSSAVRDMVVADPSLISIWLEVARGASRLAQAAIGRGLGRAALALVQTSPELAQGIQTQVAAAGLSELTLAFIESSGTPLTASNAGAQPPGGAPGAGVGGPTEGGEGSDSSGIVFASEIGGRNANGTQTYNFSGGGGFTSTDRSNATSAF